MEISSEEITKIKELLKAMYVFSIKEDWSESYAQELMVDGAFLYTEIFNK